MKRLQEQGDTGLMRKMDEESVALFIRRMMVIRHGEGRLSALIQVLRDEEMVVIAACCKKEITGPLL